MLTEANERVSSFIRTHHQSRLGLLLLLGPAALAIFLLMILPTLIIIDFSLKPFIDAQIRPGFTLAHYERILLPIYQTITIRTVRIGVVVVICNLFIGFPLAYAAVRGGRRLGGLIVIATLAPLSIDLVIRSFGWFILLGNSGIINSVLIELGLVTTETAPVLIFNETGIIIGMVHVTLPFMVFPIINVLHTIPRSLEEAARNLGANRLTVFTRVLLPLSLPGISAGILITFTVTMASFVTPKILGGSTRVLPVAITEAFTNSNNWPFGSALSILLVVIALVVILFYQRVQSRISKMGGAN